MLSPTVPAGGRTAPLERPSAGAVLGRDVFVSFQTAPEQPLIPQTFLAGPCAVRLCAGRWASLQAEEDRRVSEHRASRARKTRGGRPPDIGGQWGPLGDRKGRELGRGRGLQTLLLILSFEKQRGRLLKQNETRTPRTGVKCSDKCYRC